jgi:hypothetical protein
MNASFSKHSKGGNVMVKKMSPMVLVVCLFTILCPSMASAGVEPSPFQPEINKLHSIELNIAAINKRLAKITESDPLPDGLVNYLNAMANQMNALYVRLEEALLVLPSPSLTSPYDGQDEVVFALDGIRGDSGGINLIIDRITSRMGVEPSPFKIGPTRIIEGIDFHLFPILSPPTLP